MTLPHSNDCQIKHGLKYSAIVMICLTVVWSNVTVALLLLLTQCVVKNSFVSSVLTCCEIDLILMVIELVQS